MKKLISLILITLTFMVQAEKKKVLYFTHEPGQWHDYTTQKKLFLQIAEKAGWDLTVSTGTYDGQIQALRSPDFAKGFDAVVYNFCFAKSVDLKALENLMAQTREKGVPAFLIHGCMHSFWATFKTGKEGSVGDGYNGKALADPKLVADWKKENPGKPFPIWGDFTGIASVKHGPKTPIKVSKCCDHDIIKTVSKEGFTTPNAELYNNFYINENVLPLLKGEQENYPNAIAKKLAKGKPLTEKEKNTPKSKDEAIVMWLVPQGKSQVLSLSLGHGELEWKMPEFQNLVIDGVNFLMKK